jgi:hypothetical protein
MIQTARGRFDVSLAPQEPEPGVGDPTVMRMAIAKHLHGDLEGESQGEMLAVRSGVDGSAGYVAMERVTASLNGMSGTFALQHSGTANRGDQALVVSVVPDSGTDGLTGISGVMRITVVGDQHRYEFDYGFVPAPTG